MQTKMQRAQRARPPVWRNEWCRIAPGQRRQRYTTVVDTKPTSGVFRTFVKSSPEHVGIRSKPAAQAARQSGTQDRTGNAETFPVLETFPVESASAFPVPVHQLETFQRFQFERIGNVSTLSTGTFPVESCFEHVVNPPTHRR